MQAGVIHAGQAAAYMDGILAELNSMCRSFPFREEFLMTHSPKEYQYTLYYHDQAGGLVQTVPPEGVELLDDATTDKWVRGAGDRATDMPPHRMRTTYAYNSLGQLRRSQTPDGGGRQVLYDGKDRVRLSQDARQQPGGDWAYVKYDGLGRTTESGLCSGCTGITPTAINDMAFPDRGSQVLSDITTTFYDTPHDPAFTASNLRTRVSAVTREDAEGDLVSTQLYGYDDHGNVHVARTVLAGFGTYELSYAYDLVSGNVNRADYQAGRPEHFAHRYAYDADNRLVKAWTSRDGVFWDMDARYFYYPHGPLARVELGQDHVQGLDHHYTVHGWIKGVNMPGVRDGSVDPGLDGELLAAANPRRRAGRDAAAYWLGFYASDYKPSGGTSVPTGLAGDGAWAATSQHVLSLPSPQSAGLYNGNIALMLTDLKRPDAALSFLGGAVAEAYQYDQLNRIRQQRSYHRGGGNWVRASNGRGLWDSDYTYDRNGNILSLRRRVPDVSLGSWNNTFLRDNLVYTYAAGAQGRTDNRLLSAGDLEPAHAGLNDDYLGTAFTYDPVGNIVTDASANISSIRWDLQGKVREVQRSLNSSQPEIEFWYDAAGNRVRKRTTTPSQGGPVLHEEWYARDPQGNELAVYERYEDNGFVVTRLKERAIYGSDRLGLDLNGMEISRRPVELGPGNDPMARHALLIGELLYDSPATPSDERYGKEKHDGEYVLLINTSSDTLDLPAYRLLAGGDTLPLAGSLTPGGRVIVGNAQSAAEFLEITNLDPAWQDSLLLLPALRLPDRGGIVSVLHETASPSRRGGTLIDAIPYSDFYGLSAEKAYIYDTLQAGRSLKTVRRESYSSGPFTGGEFARDEVTTGDANPGIEPKPSLKPASGRYTLNRGRKVYELKNHPSTSLRCSGQAWATSLPW